MMEHAKQTVKRTQVSSLDKDDLTADSDRVKAPVVGASLTVSGGGKTCEYVKNRSEATGLASATGTATDPKQARKQEEGEDPVLSLRETLESIQSFVAAYRNVHAPIREGIDCALSKLGRLERWLKRKIDGSAERQTSTKRSASTQTADFSAPVFRTQESTGTKRKDATPPRNAREKVRKKSVIEEEPSEQWTVMDRAKTRKKSQPLPRGKSPRIRPEAVIVKGTDSKITYSEILKQVKEKSSSAEVRKCVNKLRRTKDGSLLIELTKEGSAEAVLQAVSRTLGEGLTATKLAPKTLIEVRDVDEVTTKEEVKEALILALGEGNANSVEVRALRPAYGGTQLAIALITSAAATQLLKDGKVKIGWVNARVRERREVSKCFTCLGFGHIAANCTSKGSGNAKLCFNCGKIGHLVAQCKLEARCPACEALGVHSEHRAGVVSCTALRRAREAQVRKTR